MVAVRTAGKCKRPVSSQSINSSSGSGGSRVGTCGGVGITTHVCRVVIATAGHRARPTAAAAAATAVTATCSRRHSIQHTRHYGTGSTISCGGVSSVGNTGTSQYSAQPAAAFPTAAAAGGGTDAAGARWGSLLGCQAPPRPEFGPQQCD